MSSPKVGFVSLGCPKALVDSERILTQLRTEGYAITPDYDNADVVVVNTCGFIDSAKADGARLVAGGGPAAGGELSSGLFIQPTIFADVDNTMALARDEIFGPVLSIIPFDDEDEAIRIANDTPFGLASGIWTQNLNRMHRVSAALKVGMVWVNTYRAVAAQTPFGGVKESGIGRERGQEGLMEFLTTKNVMISLSEEDRDPFAVQT